ncbi:MAG: cytochrome c, partial [Rhodanobacter sp.]
MKWLRRGVGLLVVLLLIGAAAWWYLARDQRAPSTPVQREADAAALVDPARIERGKYLATVGDCAACHTARGGQPY